jgi:hypothetical protein
MSTAQELRHSKSIIVASYITWVNISDIQLVSTQEARNTEIENFKRTIVYRLSTEIELFAGSALGIYGRCFNKR